MLQRRTTHSFSPVQAAKERRETQKDEAAGYSLLLWLAETRSAVHARSQLQSKEKDNFKKMRFQATPPNSSGRKRHAFHPLSQLQSKEEVTPNR